MTTVNSPDWKGFSDQFSRQHDGWSASLQVRQSGGAKEVEVDDRPFRGLTFEHRDGHDAMILTFGDDPDEHLTHIIEQPREMALLDGETGHCSLIIGLPDGTGYELELSNPFNPD